MQDKKKDNVVGIGHNNNVSKEQYAKIVNKLHRMLKYSQQEINRVERFLDQAFTKYPFSNPYQPKLKEFEVHEARAEGKDTASRYDKYAKEHIENLEAKAKAEGIELELNKSEESDED
jgi:hypothetical protein|tara:strand:+ start:114 stop:467 length:354 start_codon:yes stop_codon:yes gene_type:complete